MTIYDKAKMQSSIVQRDYNTTSLTESNSDPKIKNEGFDSLYNIVVPHANSIPQRSVTSYIDPSRSIFAADSISARILSVGVKSWTSNVVWNNSTADTIEWNAHTLVFADGTSVNIQAGDYTTSDTTTRFYIYYKKGTTIYSVTSNPELAAGNDRFVVASFQNTTSGVMTIFPVNSFGTLIDGSSITTGIIQSHDGRTFFDLDGSKIQMSDADEPRWVANGSEPRFVISRDGFNANSATPSQSLMYISGTTTVVRQEFVYTNGFQMQISNFFLTAGFVARDSSGLTNFYTGVSFYKPSNWEILEAELELKFNDATYDNGAPDYILTRNSNLSFRINPTKTTNGGGANPHYWTFSGGTSIATGFTPSSDEQVQNYTLDGTQIGAFSNGWNRIIVQQDTLSDSAFGIVGAQLRLIVAVTVN